jgi:hypothetical protein
MIFAIDFDGTIVEHRFPKIGVELPHATEVIKLMQAVGHKIIIWTCRCEPFLAPMSAWLAERGVVPDAINSNVVAVQSFAMPKVLADVYLDDRNFPPFPGWLAVQEKFVPLQR